MLDSSGSTGRSLSIWVGLSVVGLATWGGCGSQQDIVEPAASVPAEVAAEEPFPQVEYEFVPFTSAAELLDLPGAYVVRAKPVGATKATERCPDRPKGLPGSEGPAFLLTESSNLVVSEVLMLPDKEDDPFASDGATAPQAGQAILAGRAVTNSAARDMGVTNLDEAGHPEEGDVFGWGEALYVLWPPDPNSKANPSLWAVKGVLALPEASKQAPASEQQLATTDQLTVRAVVGDLSGTSVPTEEVAGLLDVPVLVGDAATSVASPQCRERRRVAQGPSRAPLGRRPLLASPVQVGARPLEPS